MCKSITKGWKSELADILLTHNLRNGFQIHLFELNNIFRFNRFNIYELFVEKDGIESVTNLRFDIEKI